MRDKLLGIIPKISLKHILLKSISISHWLERVFSEVLLKVSNKKVTVKLK